MFSLIRSVALCAALGLSGIALGADWPQYLGPARDGFSPETGINKDWKAKEPKLLWKVDLTDNGYACMSAAGGQVFIVDHKGKQDIVRAFDINSGKENWTLAYDEPAAENYGFARAAPLYEEGKLWTLSQGGILHCLDAKSGKVIWKRSIVADFGGEKPEWDYAGAPVLDGDKLIITISPNALVGAVNKNTGELLFKGGKDEKMGYSTPVVATIGGQKQYVYLAGKSLVGLNAQNGEVIWSYPWETQYDVNASTPRIIDDKVFISSNWGHGCALVQVSGKSAKAVWENQQFMGHFNTPLVYQAKVYGVSEPGDLVCLDLATGKPAWRQKGFGKGGVCGVDGAMIAIDGAGGDVVIAALDAGGYKEMGRIKPLGGESWTPPIVAEGKLIVRNKKGMVCLDLK